MTRTEAYLALNLLPKIGPVRVRRLIDVFGSPERILSAKANEITAIDGFGNDLAEAISGWESKVDLARELRRITEENLTVLTQEDALYPKLLKQIHDPPLVLYVRGQLTERDHHGIAIVGSRHATHYGLSVSKKLAFQIAYAGFTVLSGLARGIDTAAHQGALAAKGRTIAVLGSGLSQLYPPENLGLAEKIAESGAVVSEYPMERPADRQTFPYRNRIVAGWGRGLLVVEAGLNSGALITANQAVEQGRTVFAVPGQIDRPTSAGTNRLIQQGARLVTSADDILDELGTLIPRGTSGPLSGKSARTDATDPAPAPALSHDETLLVTALQVGELTVDELSQATRLPLGKISGTLLSLEMKRLIRALPGHRYARV